MALVFCRGLGYQPRMASESIDKLARTLADTLPQGLRSVGDDLESHFRAVLKQGLGKMDLVTREEFEVQEAVLARTREFLEGMEQRLADLEDTSAASKTGKKTARRRKKAS